MRIKRLTVGLSAALLAGAMAITPAAVAQNNPGAPAPGADPSQLIDANQTVAATATVEEVEAAIEEAVKDAITKGEAAGKTDVQIAADVKAAIIETAATLNASPAVVTAAVNNVQARITTIVASVSTAAAPSLVASVASVVAEAKTEATQVAGTRATTTTPNQNNTQTAESNKTTENPVLGDPEKS